MKGLQLERTIALVGFPGSGKSKVGQVLQAKYSVVWHDLDAEIERLQGRSITNIIREEGESTFRKAEEQTLRAYLLENEPCVLSLGGGALLSQANKELLMQNSIMVHLKVKLETAVERIYLEEIERQSNNKTAKRPLVAPKKGENLTRELVRENVEQLYREREHLYEVAPISVDTDDKTAEAIAKEIADLLQANS